jgi:hypothetical protein
VRTVAKQRPGRTNASSMSPMLGRFNAASIVMRTLVPECPQFQLF